MLQNISGLGLTSAQLKLLEGLVIIQQNSLRTTNNLALAILGNDICGITSPNINTHNTIQLGINGDSTRLGIGSATRNRSVALQIGESLYITSVAGACGCRIQSIQICSIDNVFVSHRLFHRLLRQSTVIIENSLIAGEPQITLAVAQLTLNNHLSSGVGQEHSGALYSCNLASQTIHYITTLTLGDCDSVMENLLVIIDNGMLRTRIINHLVITSNEQLLTNRVNNLWVFIILILGNYLYINTRNGRQLNGAENITTLGTGHKTLSRLGEHHFGTVNITLITIFVFQNTILQTLKGDRITHITLLLLVLNRNYLNTSRRNIEGNVGALDNKNLTIDIILVLFNNYITFGIYNLSTFTLGLLGIINTSQQILVSAKSMTLDNLSHLAGIQSERHRAANIDLTTNINIFRKIVRGADCRTFTTMSGVLQNQIPILRGRGKQINGFIIGTGNKFLGSNIESNQLIRLGQRSLSRTDVAQNIALGAVQHISILVNREDKVLLDHSIFTHVLYLLKNLFFIHLLYILYYFFLKKSI